MSYARWSCDNYKSDVYVYESNEGFETHIATRRLVGTPPYDLCEVITGNLPEREKARQLEAYNKFMGNCEYAAINLPEASETIIDPDAASCLATLFRLRELGYHIPDQAIKLLVAEQ